LPPREQVRIYGLLPNEIIVGELLLLSEMAAAQTF
jgi:hypothetical protein